MKYLTITSPRGNLAPEIAGGVFQAGKEWLNAGVADGTLDFVHGFPAGGGVAVANADSHEALMDRLREFPLFPFVDWDVRPLVDINQSLDSAIQLFQRMGR